MVYVGRLVVQRLLQAARWQLWVAFSNLWSRVSMEWAPSVPTSVQWWSLVVVVVMAMVQTLLCHPPLLVHPSGTDLLPPINQTATLNSSSFVN